MKKISSLIAILLLCAVSLFAQAPEKFTYQAVVRNANNSLVANAQVGMRVSILQGSANGSAVYVETQTGTTNTNGLLTVEIGGGNAQQGTFASIDWANGPFFLKTETDPDGGTNYSITSTQQMLSVPYALYAKDAGNGFSGDYNDLSNTPTIPTVPTNVSSFTNDAGYISSYTETDPQYNAWNKDYNDLINKPTIPTVPENVSAFNNDVPYLTVEQQILSISNDTIFLTGGSFVKLPAGFSGDYNDLTNKPEIPTVPTNVSTFTNDANYVSNTACADVDLCAISVALSQLQALVQEQQQRIEDLEAAIGTTDTTIIPVDTTTTFTNPTVSTDYATNVTETSATLNGTISNPDNVTITAQGFEWKATDGGSYTQVVVTGDTLTYNLANLTANTSYTYRSFITYEDTIVYGNEVTFTTNEASAPLVDAQPCPGTPTLTDYDGNTYNTVQIGNQCWMRDNLRTTYYADGTAIPAGETNTDATLPYYYDYISSDIPLTQRGYLYNWPAVMRDASSSSANPSGVQGICPTGWHVPSDEEWMQLTNYVSAQNEYLCSDNAEFIAKVLASITGWSSSTSTCAVGNLQNLNNATGFNASPAGYLYNLGFTNSGKYAYFWTSTAASSTNAWYRSLNFNYAYVYRNNYGKHFGYSVRCLRDEGGSSTVQLPTVTTATMSDITANSATSGGNVTSDGGATVTARGVCWSTSQNPTVSDDHTTDGSGTGSFTSNLTNLTPGTTYYVRAYATNSMGTAYGSEESFTTTAALPQDGQPCVGAATVTDYDGHTYNTVQLGSQCWMAENLRTSHYSDGTAIPTGDGWSSTEPLYYTLEDSLEHGYLYNWRAVMHNSSSSQATPSGVQGVCPTGWHVPSDAEWTELETYVGNQSQYLCNNDSSYIAKALSATSGWIPYSETCAVGNDQSTNNSTGFGAFPVDEYPNLSYALPGTFARFWSSTEYVDGTARYLSLHYNAAYVSRSATIKYYGCSVRCLRD